MDLSTFRMRATRSFVRRATDVESGLEALTPHSVGSVVVGADEASSRSVDGLPTRGFRALKSLRWTAPSTVRHLGRWEVVAAIVTAVISVAIHAPCAYAEMLPIFGPNHFARTRQTRSFFIDRFANCEAAAQYKIVVINGYPDGTNRVQRAEITLNGTKVVGFADFRLQRTAVDRRGGSVGRIEKPILVQPENDLHIRIKGRAAGFLTISVECTANCLDVGFAFPAASAVLTQSTTLVTGRVTTASSDVGVSVNGVVAAVHATDFAIPNLPLALGQTSLMAEATNACFSKAVTSLPISVAALEESPLSMTATPPRGVAPLAVQFEADLLSPQTFASAAWDLDGDGVIDVTGPTLGSVSHTYQTPGLFTPSLVVTDTGGHKQRATLVVAAYSLAEVETQLRRRWSVFQEAIAGGDLDRALQSIAETSRPQYQRALAAAPDLAAVARSLEGTPDLVQVRGGIAVLRLGQILAECVIDRDGMWRIRFF